MVYTTLPGQTIVLSENFSGFTTGSHTTPSTVDASLTSLDSKTQTIGWTGSGIYPAAGEIKVGTSATPGWIETPAIDLSADGGKFKVKIDICRWPGDATTVQVLLNGTAIGATLTPGDNFETIELTGTGGTASSKIKIQALTKRFFLDNFSVSVSNITTGIRLLDGSFPDIYIYPIPASNILNLRKTQNINRVEICDLSGKKVMMIRNTSGDEMQIDIETLGSGIYLIRFISGNRIQIKKFIKL